MPMIIFRFFPMLATPKTANYKLTGFRGFSERFKGCQQEKKSKKNQGHVFSEDTLIKKSQNCSGIQKKSYSHFIEILQAKGILTISI